MSDFLSISFSPEEISSCTAGDDGAALPVHQVFERAATLALKKAEDQAALWFQVASPSVRLGGAEDTLALLQLHPEHEEAAELVRAAIADTRRTQFVRH